jgi:hypothetical protein
MMNPAANHLRVLFRAWFSEYFNARVKRPVIFLSGPLHKDTPVPYIDVLENPKKFFDECTIYQRWVSIGEFKEMGVCI